jgi:hypothetical protein
MNGVQEAWGRGHIAAALMMDIKSAFPSVAKECLVEKMREMGFDENFFGWTKSFIGERRVVMALGRYEGSRLAPRISSFTNPICYLYCRYT